MWYIRKIDPLKLIAGQTFVAFTGAGGKTSFIELLARRAAATGRKTAIVTTTKMYARQPFVLLNEMPSHGKTANPIQIGHTVENGKITALPEESIKEIGHRFDVVLIEADGANRKPLKYPAEYEPVIPVFCDSVFVLAGLDGLFGTVKSKIFRFELLSKAQAIPVDEVLTPDLFPILFSKQALLKGTENRTCFIVLNKFDVLKNRNILFPIAKKVMEYAGTSKIIVSSIAHQVFYQIDQFAV